MTIAQRAQVFITHIMSRGPAARMTGTTNAASSTSIRCAVGTFTFGVNVFIGDVVRITAGPYESQAGIVTGVPDTGTLSITPNFPQSIPSLTTFRVEAPRQYTDASPYLVSLELEDPLDTSPQEVVLTLANGGNRYTGLFAEKDPVEVWAEDADAGTPAVNFSNNAHRCFVGRIARIELDASTQGRKIKIIARDHSADTQETPVTAAFLGMNLIWPGFPFIPENVFDTLGGELNARRGANVDTATGQPSFLLESIATDASIIPATDLSFQNQSYYDAFAQIAQAVLDNQAPPQSFVFTVDSFTYAPRDPGPNDPGGSVTNRPTIRIKSNANMVGAALGWSIAEGVNVLNATPVRTVERTRNRVTLLSQLEAGGAIIITKDAPASGPNAAGQDRYGVMEGVSEARGFNTGPYADAAAAGALGLVRQIRQERTVRRLGIAQPGRRLSGAEVTTTLPTGDLSAPTALGIVKATLSLSPRGVSSTFDLTRVRPGWNTLLAPVAKNLEETGADIWAHYYAYFSQTYPNVAEGASVTIRRSAPTQWGTTSTILFTIAAPGAKYRFEGFSFHQGKLALAWWLNDNTDPDYPRKNVIKIVDAYDGTVLVTSSVVFTAPTARFIATIGDVWFHSEDATNYAVWARGTSASASVYAEVLVPKAGGASAVGPYASTNLSLTNGAFFVQVRDDGHRVIHTRVSGPPPQFATFDIETGDTETLQELTPGVLQLFRSDRAGGNVLMVEDKVLKFVKKWGGPYELVILGNAEPLADCFDLVPFTKYYYVPG